jgi:hypothetical protein
VVGLAPFPPPPRPLLRCLGGTLATISEAVGVVLFEAICQRGERITTVHMSFFATTSFYSTNEFITSMTATI